ncbi:MAG: PBP1A family penicillin-binding protein [Desulfobacterales bacterium]
MFSKKTIYIALLLLGGLLGGTLIGIVVGLTHDLPQIRSLEKFKPSEVTRIYSADKALLSELFIEKRDLISLQRMPRYLKEAILATEDRSFYNHGGVDLKGILRAIIHDILAGEFIEGASTITQQLAKTLFLTPRKTLTRKIKEAFLAFQLERRYTKDEILEFYLNQIYLGSGAYGVESAARIYFGKPIFDLGLAECALIAGLPKAPSRYSPLIHKDLALKRRNTVLRQMHAMQIITPTAFKKAIQEPIQLKPQKETALVAPYFAEYVRKFLVDTFGSALVYRGGLSVRTTLFLEFQQAAQSAVRKGLKTLKKRMQRRGIKNPKPQAALISLDVKSGQIRAMVGGKDYALSSFNRATMARRLPGSAFKPIVYAHAIEQGFPQNKTLIDAPVSFDDGPKRKPYEPENFSKEYKGEMTLRKALAISENIPAIKLNQMLGPSSVAQFGHQLGIESILAPNLSLALGTSATTLVELTAAYAVFPNKGKWIRPHGILEVLDNNNRILWQAKAEQKIALSRSGAAIMTDMLQAVVKEGTGRMASVIKHPIGGKTGTSDDNKDALFIGFSPAIAAGVWVGQDSFTSLGHRETGARAALPIWIEFMTTVLSKLPYQYFDIPDDGIKVSIDPITGRAVSEDDPKAVTALFKKGTEPKRY